MRNLCLLSQQKGHQKVSPPGVDQSASDLHMACATKSSSGKAVGCHGASTSTACVGACAAVQERQQRQQRQRGLETGANEKSSAGKDCVGELHDSEAVGLPLDAQSLSLWLATEHRRVLSAMLLSSLDGSAPDATRSAAKAIVRSETLEQARTLTIDRWGNRAQAPSAETLQLCIGLLRTLSNPALGFTPAMMWIALFLTLLSGVNYLRASASLFREQKS